MSGACISVNSVIAIGLLYFEMRNQWWSFFYVYVSSSCAFYVIYCKIGYDMQIWSLKENQNGFLLIMPYIT